MTIWPSVGWNLFHVTILAPRISIDFRKMCVSLIHKVRYE
jgi:hypothetical protein